MSWITDYTTTGAVEVRIYRDAELVARELCESEDEATIVMEHWSELGNVSFLVDDVSVQHGPGDVLAPEPPDLRDEDHYSIADTSLPDRGVE